MKQIALAVIFIIILISSIYFENSLVEENFNKLKTQINNFETLVLTDTEQVETQENKDSLQDIIDWWGKKEPILLMFLSHSPLEEITKELSEIRVALDFNDGQQVISSIRLILDIIEEHNNFAVISWLSIM